MATYAAVNIGKSFSGVTVLDNVSFSIQAGEVHALLGENGSGKSTLIKILGGVYQPTTGSIELNGQRVGIQSPAHAQKQGLAIVHQDYALFPELDVATNVTLASPLPVRRFLRTVDRQEIQRTAKAVLSSLGLHIDTQVALGSLSLAEWKLIECARALVTKPTFLILDEPTALLDANDSRRIMALIKQLRADGIGVAFVSHRLDEALEVADRITILRDGTVSSVLSGKVTAETLVPYIVGDKAHSTNAIETTSPKSQDVVLRLLGARAIRGATPFDLDLNRGEILGLTGLIGSGALEVARMIAGRRTLTGAITVNGERRSISSPHAAIQAGIGYIPEERAELGLVMDMSTVLNINLATLSAISPLGILLRSRARARARHYAKALTINTSTLEEPVRMLSGGNQQKVQIAKWLASRMAILVIESPTHGVDVGAKVEIHHLMRQFARDGGAIIVASTDIPEVLAIADRIAVFNRGDLVAVSSASHSGHGEILLSGAYDKRVSDIESLLAR